MMRLVGVGKRYGRGPLVLDRVHLEVRVGEPLVVHGANGTGKSTLLRVIAGCLAPSTGRVTGRPATVGYVPDRFPGRLRMPADAYLRHLRRIRPGRPASGDPHDLLARLGFRGGLDTPMNQLSKGNAQKVGLAQALCAGAPLVVLDEPWSGLDADARPVLTSAVARLVGDGIAVVLADHTRTAVTLPGHRSVLLLDTGLAETAPGLVEPGGADFGLVDGGGTVGPGPVGNGGAGVRIGEGSGGRRVAVTLWCVAPDRVAGRLGVFGVVERRVDGLVLLVDAASVDDLLRAALGLGCSVREVRECVR